LGWWVGSSRYLSETSNSPTSTTHKSRHWFCWYIKVKIFYIRS
jgi:hypothetical protein